MKKGGQSQAEPEADAPEAVLLEAMLLSARLASRLINFSLATSGREEYLPLHYLPVAYHSFVCPPVETPCNSGHSFGNTG